MQKFLKQTNEPAGPFEPITVDELVPSSTIEHIDVNTVSEEIITPE